MLLSRILCQKKGFIDYSVTRIFPDNNWPKHHDSEFIDRKYLSNVSKIRETVNWDNGHFLKLNSVPESSPTAWAGYTAAVPYLTKGETSVKELKVRLENKPTKVWMSYSKTKM